MKRILTLFRLFLFCLTLLHFNAAYAQFGGNDPTFNPGGFEPGEGANNGVYKTVVQSDGKILVGGWFTTFHGLPYNRLTRLNPDGSIDPSFNIGSGPNDEIHTISLQSDGKIIIGGWFTSYNGTDINRIARLNIDGSLDLTFNPGDGANSLVATSFIQLDGKILIGGWFSQFDGVNRNFLARLNSDGSFDNTFNMGAGANSNVLGIALQADGKIIICGQFSSYNGTTRNSVARLNPDGTLETTFNSSFGANGPVYSVAVQSDGKAVICGNFTTYGTIARNRIARINNDGFNDSSFDPGTGLNIEARSLLIQSDGKILVGGSFTSFNGVSRVRIARINSNGALDTSFDPGTGASGVIHHVALQTDGKILAGGGFTSFNGAIKNRVVRLNSNGSLDALGPNDMVFTTQIQPDGKIIIGGGFTNYIGIGINRIARLNENGSLDLSFNPGTGANGNIQKIVLQPDGKILIAGSFTSYNGTTRNRIARLNPDGSLDLTFDPGTGANNSVRSMAVQTDGRIIIGGDFMAYNGTSINRIARLNSDGTLDASFNPGSGTNGSVLGILIQSDGKIVIAGYFPVYNGLTVNSICRLNSDGSLDSSFNAGSGVDNTILDIAIQSDGKFVIAGQFTIYNGSTSFRIARLNENGTFDPSFNIGTGASQFIQTLILQPDGKVVIAGEFTTFSGVTRNRIARLNTNGSLDLSFNPGIGANTTIRTSALQADGKIMIGGEFLSYAGMGRNRVARVLAYCSPPGAPTGTGSQTFCNSATVTNLTATGTGIQWYAASTGGTALSAGTALANGSTYYASQTVGGCESTDRLEVAVTINAPAAPTGSASQEFCNAATVADLTATGSGIQWYTAPSGGTALTAGTTLSNGTYYASQTISGCESINRLAVTVSINAPAAPTGTTTQSFCGPATLADITVTGANITWYNAASAGTVLGGGTALGDGVTYFASQTVNGCESLNRLAVTATVNAIPAAPTAAAAQEFCNGATVADLTATGSGVQWFTAASGGTALTIGTTLASGSYFAAQTVNGCESTDRTEVTVNIITPATPTGDAAQNFCSASTVADLTATGTAIQWYTQATGGTALAAGTALSNGTYYASQTINGCESERLEVTVTITILDATATENGLTLTANQAGAAYTWVDCNNSNQPIAGATAQSYTATANGSYAVIVEQNGCSVTSNCVAITTVSLDDIKTELFRIYPNPASTVINVEMANTSTIRLFDVSGKLLKEVNGASIYTIDVTDLTIGMYMIESAEGAKAKFVKQ
jgi:uncharacterized delta-60 repeat protein